MFANTHMALCISVCNAHIFSYRVCYVHAFNKVAVFIYLKRK